MITRLLSSNRHSHLHRVELAEAVEREADYELVVGGPAGIPRVDEGRVELREDLVQQRALGAQRDALTEVGTDADGDALAHAAAAVVAVSPGHQQLDERLDVVVVRLRANNRA